MISLRDRDLHTHARGHVHKAPAYCGHDRDGLSGAARRPAMPAARYDAGPEDPMHTERGKPVTDAGFARPEGALVMAASSKDPSDPIRIQASGYPGVDEGTACTQSSFKAGKTAFLYIGMQGGRHKAMFKLRKSMPEAVKLAASEPSRYEVGSTAWVTARFTADEPMPRKLWKKWLDESYELSLAGGAGRRAPSKKAAKKKTKPGPA